MKRFILMVAVAGLVLATTGIVYAQSRQALTASGLVELLVARGIVPPSLAERARTLAHMIERNDASGQSTAAEDTPQGALNAAYAEVRVSQLIEHANLEFAEGEDLEGMLLLLRNASSSGLMFEARRGCQVVYRITREEGELVYDSALHPPCTGDERVTYFLPGGDTRMFTLKHQVEKAPLTPGRYTVLLHYPGYGSGTLLVTVR